MVNDIWSVTWKELMVARRNLRAYTTSYVFLVIIWGVVIPATSVDGVLQGDPKVPFLSVAFLAVLLASGQTISAFVGERMQKTLGTLLTTRLPDSAIYLGKVFAIIIVSYIVLLMVFSVHLFTLWFGASLKGVLIGLPYTPLQMACLLILPILALWYTSSLGVYISLKMESVRGQHFLNLFMGMPVLGVFYFVVSSLSLTSLMLGILIFGFVTLGITAFSIRRFNRQTLILL